MALGMAVTGLITLMAGAALEWGSYRLGGRDVVGSGYSGGDGLVTTVLGVAAVVATAAGALLGRARAGAAAALVAGALVVVVAAVNVADIRDRPAEVREQVRGIIPVVESTIGPGLWITLAGGILLVAAGLVGLAGARRRRP